MSEISELTMRKLTISKYMYLQGLSNSKKKSTVNAIQTIINYDYAVETAVKTALLYKDIPLTLNKKFKDFPTLITDIKEFIINETLLREIESLHKIRNDVQHDSRIPSDDDVSRFTITVKYLLDEICATIFLNQVTFESISLTFIIDSQIERIILSEIDKAIESERYSHSVSFAKFLINYHTRIIQEDTPLPYKFSYRTLTFLPRFGSRGLLPIPHELERIEKGLEIISSYLEGVDEAVKWLISRTILPEYQVEISNVFGSDSYNRVTETEHSEEKAFRARSLAYKIIAETQWQLKDPEEIKEPQIFYSTIVTKNGFPVLQLGVAYIGEVLTSSIDAAYKESKKNFNINVKQGYQEITLDRDILNYGNKALSIRTENGSVNRLIRGEKG